MENHLSEQIEGSLCETRRPRVFQKVAIQIVEHLFHCHYEYGELLPLLDVLFKELVGVGFGLQGPLKPLLNIIFDFIGINVVELMGLVLFVTQSNDACVSLHMLLALTRSLLLGV